MRLVVTGAGGFVGTALCRAAEVQGHEVLRVTRSHGQGSSGSATVEAIDGQTDWGHLLDGADAVIHLAARVHVLRESAKDPLAAFRKVNVDGTRRLAERAASAGVRRLVLVSSIKVLGEETVAAPFGPESVPAPQDHYGQSKLEAEAALRDVATRYGLETVILRPPLVHGPGAGGNLRRLMGLIRQGVPLPFAGIENRRSLIGVDNLVSALIHSSGVSAAAGQILLIADQPPPSTPGLIRILADAMALPARLFSVPAPALRLLGRLAGRSEEVGRLTGSLEVDDRRTRALLQWTPPVTLEAGLREMARAYLMEHVG